MPITNGFDGYRIIDPDQYADYGVDPADVLAGTVPSEDHPGYMMSRFGGNAFGLGLFEQAGRLNDEQTGFLSEVDLDDARAAAAQADRINTLFKSLGLYVRYSRLGRPYYLIPLAWLGHTTAEVQDLADQMVNQLRLFQQDWLQEHLAVLLLGQDGDLIVQELLWRLGGHRLVRATRLQDLSRIEEKFDLVLLPCDPMDFVTQSPLTESGRRQPSQAKLFNLGRYLVGKLFDLLKPDGRLIVAARRWANGDDEVFNIRFLNHGELKNFLLFSHIYTTSRPYSAPVDNGKMEVCQKDLLNFLTQEMVSRETLDKLTSGRRPDELSLKEIDALPRLGQKGPARRSANQSGVWSRLFDPFFEPRVFGGRPLTRTRKSWSDRFELSRPLPDTGLLFVGDRRHPAITLADLESQADRMGLKGCPLTLVADYKDSFDYVLKVLDMLGQLKSDKYRRLPVLQLIRFRRLLEGRSKSKGFMREVNGLLRSKNQIKQMANSLNPMGLEGPKTSVLANIEKLSLLGIRPTLLREMFLIVIGHSTIGRISIGKLPEKSLGPLINQLRTHDPTEALQTIRAIRLLTLAEMAAMDPQEMSSHHAGHMIALADQMIRLLTEPDLDWEQLEEQALGDAGGPANWAVRRLLKLFSLHEYLDSWYDLLSLGRYEAEGFADYKPEKAQRIAAVQDLAAVVRRFRERYADRPTPDRPYFFRRFLDMEFHGTNRMMPALGPALGFPLVWIAVHVSPTAAVDFNQLVSGLEIKSHKQALSRLRQALGRLTVEDLSPDYLGLLGREMKPDRPVFIRDSGLTLTYNPQVKTLEASVVDVEAHQDRLAELAGQVLGKPLSDLSRSDLAEMEWLYARLEDYFSFMELPGMRSLARGRYSDLFPERRTKFAALRQLIKESLSDNLFKPEHLFDQLIRLSEQAPRLSGFLIPEIVEMTGLPPAHPRYPGETMFHFFLRAAYKFGMLASGRIESFQDEDLLHRVALREFGPEAAGGIGLTREQIVKLAAIVAKIRENRDMIEAIGASLVFQDVGLLPSYRERYGDQIDLSDHGPAGQAILERSGLLDRFPLSQETKHYAGLLIRHHGLLARTIRGEALPTALAPVIGIGDELVFESFFIQNLVTMAASREDYLTDDLMEQLFDLRRSGLKAIRRNQDWAALVRREELAKAVLPAALEEINARERDKPPTITELRTTRQRLAEVMSNQEKWAWQSQVTGMERGYRLRGLWFIDYQSVALFKAKMPIEYIRNRLGLRTISRGSLERALFEAIRIESEGLDRLGPDLRNYILLRLADLDNPVMLYGCSYIQGFLSSINRMKLMFIGLKAADLARGDEKRSMAVDFRNLELIIRDRYEFVNSSLAEIDLTDLENGPEAIQPLVGADKGVFVELNPELGLVNVDFADPLTPTDFQAQAAVVDDPEELGQMYYDRLLKLRQEPFNTSVYERALEAIYEARLADAIQAMVEASVNRLLDQQDLEELHQTYEEVVDSPFTFQVDQFQRERIKNAFELRRQQLQVRYQDSVAARLEQVHDREELIGLWGRVKTEMIDGRAYLGRNLERRVGRLFDLKQERLSTWRS